VHVTKRILRWRTALVLRELEREIPATQAFAAQQRELSRMMADKETLEYQLCQLRLVQQRRGRGYGPRSGIPGPELKERLAALRQELIALDDRIAPLAKASSEVGHQLWGPSMRAGNDKSLLARQVERSADIYMSRVSNLLYQTPYAFLRSPRGSLPHDPGPGCTEPSSPS
jgi:hypothetical protein